MKAFAFKLENSPSERPLITRSTDGKIPCLDGLRALAAFEVIFFHSFPHISVLGSAYGMLWNIPSVAYAGVDLFFVLSGFLIGGILFDQRHAKNYYQTFYLRRALRILPLYYFLVVTYAGLRSVNHEILKFPLFQDPLPLWTYFLHVQNIAMVVFVTWGPRWLAASWSLAIEEQFYLLLPPIVRNVQPKTVFKIAIAAFLVSLFGRFTIDRWHYGGTIARSVLFPFCLDGISVGVVIAYLFRFEPELILKYRELITKRLLPLLLLAAIMVGLTFNFFIRFNFLQHSFNTLTFGAVLITLLLNPEGKAARILSHPISRFHGNLSYGLYLLHPICLHAAFYFLKGTEPQLGTFGDLWPITVSLASAYLAALISWKVLETPCMSLGKRFRYK